jgi:dihydrofolate reductase
LLREKIFSPRSNDDFSPPTVINSTAPEEIQMRKIIYGGANSADNLITGPDGAIDWILWDDEVTDLMKDCWESFDTLLMGRKTFDEALKFGGGKNPYLGMKCYVFSRTLKKKPNEKRQRRRNNQQKRHQICPQLKTAARQRHLPDGRRQFRPQPA